MINSASHPRVPQIIKDQSHNPFGAAVNQDPIALLDRVLAEIIEHGLILACLFLPRDSDKEVLVDDCLGADYFLNE